MGLSYFCMSVARSKRQTASMRLHCMLGTLSPFFLGMQDVLEKLEREFLDVLAQTVVDDV